VSWNKRYLDSSRRNMYENAKKNKIVEILYLNPIIMKTARMPIAIK